MLPIRKYDEENVIFVLHLFILICCFYFYYSNSLQRERESKYQDSDWLLR